MTRIAVVGGGAWGTALADLLARKGEQVTLWAREPEVVESINQRHVNDMFLPGASLAPTLGAARDIRASIDLELDDDVINRVFHLRDTDRQLFARVNWATRCSC